MGSVARSMELVSWECVVLPVGWIEGVEVVVLCLRVGLLRSERCDEWVGCCCCWWWWWY